ncbi:MAG: TrbG/VirB9 family P-type conjugative transfer protein [Vicinamibacterales bacterium]
MLQRLGRSVSVILLGLAAPVWAQSPPPASVRTARTVVYHPRDLVALRARVHYTTLIVLPEGEAVVEATCGDKEVWIVNVRDGLVSVKPAKTGTETNLNLITTSGQVYAFLLSEVSETKGVEPDLTVYLDRDDTDPPTTAAMVAPKYVPAAQLDDFKAQAELARDQATKATTAARADVEAAVTTFRTTYPASMVFSYRILQDKPPFFVRAMWHDDHRTFIQTSATELPALYAYQDRMPALVNFEVQDGTYVVPKILADGYLQLGAARLGFRSTEGR